MKKKSKRTIRKPKPGEIERYQKAVAEENRPEVMEANKALGRKLLAEKKKRTAAARAALDVLAKLKEQRGLSLAELEEATGMSSGNLSRLMNNPAPNVTVETLQRLCDAMNADLQVTVTGK